jgi:predicted MFS family arabinose efflux permease
VGAVLLAAGATLLAIRVPETRSAAAPDEAATPLVHPAALLPGIGLLVAVGALGGFFAFAVIHARAIGLEAWSGVLVVFGLTVVVCRTVFATLPDRVPPLRLASVALLVIAAGLLTVSLAAHPAGLLVGAVVLAVGVAFVTPAVFAAVFATVPANERGSAAATVSVFIDLGLGVGPMLLGLVAAGAGIPAAFAVAALAALVASAGLSMGRRRTSAAAAPR